MRSARFLASLSTAALLLAGLCACGQRGDLYLPSATRTAVPAAPLADSLAPQFARLQQASIRYQLSGHGARTLVLINARDSALESWDGCVPELAATNRVLRYDRRGLDTGSEVTDLTALLDLLAINEPVTLVGDDAGAAVALQFALLHPQRVRSLFAVGPPALASLQGRIDALTNGRGHLEVLDTAPLTASQSPALLLPPLRKFLSLAEH